VKTSNSANMLWSAFGFLVIQKGTVLARTTSSLLICYAIPGYRHNFSNILWIFHSYWETTTTVWAHKNHMYLDTSMVLTDKAWVSKSAILINVNNESVKITVVWHMLLCSSVDGYQTTWSHSRRQ
jgi:hypothetical protein